MDKLTGDSMNIVRYFVRTPSGPMPEIATFSQRHCAPIVDLRDVVERNGKDKAKYSSNDALYYLEKLDIAIKLGGQLRTDGRVYYPQYKTLERRRQAMLKTPGGEAARDLVGDIVLSPEAEAEWIAINPKLLFDLNYLKFSQNQDERAWLLNAGTDELIYAQHDDRLAGIGFTAKDAEAMSDRSRWGRNELGKALMAVRDRIVGELRSNRKTDPEWDYPENEHRLWSYQNLDHPRNSDLRAKYNILDLPSPDPYSDDTFHPRGNKADSRTSEIATNTSATPNTTEASAFTELDAVKEITVPMDHTQSEGEKTEDPKTVPPAEARVYFYNADYFHSPTTWMFSPRQRAPIVDKRDGSEERTYSSIEQLYQLERIEVGLVHGCKKSERPKRGSLSIDNAKALILKENNPTRARDVGREIILSDEAERVWQSKNQEILTDIHYLKFRQNQDERDWLLATKDYELVYVDENDLSSGIGFSEEDAEKNEFFWGDNKLGKALMAVRDRIRQELEDDDCDYREWDRSHQHRLDPAERYSHQRRKLKRDPFLPRQAPPHPTSNPQAMDQQNTPEATPPVSPTTRSRNNPITQSTTMPTLHPGIGGSPPSLNEKGAQAGVKREPDLEAMHPIDSARETKKPKLAMGHLLKIPPNTEATSHLAMPPPPPSGRTSSKISTDCTSAQTTRADLHFTVDTIEQLQSGLESMGCKFQNTESKQVSQRPLYFTVEEVESVQAMLKQLGFAIGPIV